MKVLFVHEVNWKNKPIFEIHDYPELLSIRGNKVTFIDFPEGDVSGRSFFSTYFSNQKFEDQSRAHSGSSVEVLTPKKLFPKPFDRLLHSISFIPLLIKTLRRTKFDVIVLYGVPTNGWQTVIVANFFRIPIIFRAIDVSYLLRKSVFKPLIKVAEKFIYRSVTWISANNQTLASHCVTWGASEKKISVDYPGLDLQKFIPSLRDTELQMTLGIKNDDKVVLFMGTLYRFAGIRNFLELFGDSLKCRSNFKLLIIGDGEERAGIERAISLLKLNQSVVMAGFVSYDNLPKYLNLADVAICPFDLDEVTNGALPWKVVQYLACGIPTVATPLSGLMAFTNRKDQSGVVYRSLDSTFVQAVEELMSDQSLRDELSVIARAFVSAENDWKNCILKFENRLRTCSLAE